MTKPEWGKKRKCTKCGAFFYDMQKSKFACPKCGKEFSEEAYEEARHKELMKLAKKSAPKIDDADLDEETLLKMTEDVPLGEELNIGDDGLDILDEEEDTENPKLDGVDEYDDQDRE